MEKLLLGMDALSFLGGEGLRVLESCLAAGEDEAAGAAARIGFPVALKVSSPDVVHKTETGGIRVFLKNEEEVRLAFREIVQQFRAENPEKRLEGAMVQKLGSGFELIVGTRQDKQFGPVLMFGLGGIFAEAIRDVSFRLIPIEAGDAAEMIEELKSYAALKNPRSGTVDIASIQDFLLRVSGLMDRHAEIQEMDLNPVFVTGSDLLICDARIRVAPLEAVRE